LANSTQPPPPMQSCNSAFEHRSERLAVTLRMAWSIAFVSRLLSGHQLDLPALGGSPCRSASDSPQQTRYSGGRKAQLLPGLLPDPAKGSSKLSQVPSFFGTPSTSIEADLCRLRARPHYGLNDDKDSACLVLRRWKRGQLGNIRDLMLDDERRSQVGDRLQNPIPGRELGSPIQRSGRHFVLPDLIGEAP
jgi:hypothetical protein